MWTFIVKVMPEVILIIFWKFLNALADPKLDISMQEYQKQNKVF